MATIGMCSTLRTARSRSAWPHCCMMPCCGPNRVPRAGKLREQAMSSKGRVRLILHLAAVGGLLLTTPGCESIRSAAGLTKEPPDEFAVVTHAPLNQVSPTQSAEAALYSDDPNVVAGSITGNYSQAEKVLLAQSGAANADDGIRQQIAADNRKMQTADEGFTDQLLFSTPDNGEAPLDADAEKARIDAGKAPSEAAPAKPEEKAPEIQKEDSGGWLDGIF